MSKLEADRQAIIILRQAGMSQRAVAEHLGRSERWVRKWERRVSESGSAGLEEQSRAPHHVQQKISPAVKKAVIKARVDLMAGRVRGHSLKYIGGQAIRTVLKARQCSPLPSVPTIERIIREAGLTGPKSEAKPTKVNYPHLKPQAAHILTQVDIVPHYLKGGAKVACFNAIDVYSRFPTGMAYHQQRSLDAAQFLIHVWQTMGRPRYTQVDNEGCFSGGATHAYVLGRVVRLALAVGTELIFSPTYHPQSNGYVERFHQDYNHHVWDEIYLADLAAVNAQAALFFEQYRDSIHHRQLQGLSPRAIHMHSQPHYLERPFAIAPSRRPLQTGKVHFIRRVQPDKTVRLLNVNWSVSAQPATGVWATLYLQPDDCCLKIYDKAPDQKQRICFNTHPFPLPENVVSSSDLNSEPLSEYPIASDDNPSILSQTAPSLADVFFEYGWPGGLRSLITALHWPYLWL